ncbi:MAG TPA: hypothetical protein VK025_09915 [Steroidobacter sp.]|jgi:hypothetical protein|nr:hypothetical protein [Steroidobacteraceae bacterium]HLS81705.1 hypothetical protein [Steroidobacter sp.]
MPYKLSFHLNDYDLERLAEMARESQANARNRPQDAIVAAAHEVLERGMQAQPAPFVKERYARLRTLLEMVNDLEWRLSEADRQRALNALACFSAPAGASSFEHAIMIELVCRELRHDLDAYQDFCRFRTAKDNRRKRAMGDAREAWLEQKRAALQRRMTERRTRELNGANGALHKVFSLFGL